MSPSSDLSPPGLSSSRTQDTPFSTLFSAQSSPQQERSIEHQDILRQSSQTQTRHDRDGGCAERLLAVLQHLNDSCSNASRSCLDPLLRDLKTCLRVSKDMLQCAECCSKPGSKMLFVTAAKEMSQVCSKCDEKYRDLGDPEQINHLDCFSAPTPGPRLYMIGEYPVDTLQEWHQVMGGLLRTQVEGVAKFLEQLRRKHTFSTEQSSNVRKANNRVDMLRRSLHESLQSISLE